MFGFMLGSFLAKIYVDIGFVDLGTVVISIRFDTTTISPMISKQVLLESKRSNRSNREKSILAFKMVSNSFHNITSDTI